MITFFVALGEASIHKVKNIYIHREKKRAKMRFYTQDESKS